MRETLGDTAVAPARLGWGRYSLSGGLGVTAVGSNLNPRKSVGSRGKGKNQLAFGLCFPGFQVRVKQNSSLLSSRSSFDLSSPPHAGTEWMEAPGA